MSVQEELRQAYNSGAYELGVHMAVRDAGLEKSAFIPEAVGALSRFSHGAHPALTRALIGAGIGGVAGGATDIGAGRGALAGGLAGAGSAFGAELGQKAYKGAWRQGVEKMKALKAPTKAGIDEKVLNDATKAFKQHQHAFGRGVNRGPNAGNFERMPRWHKNLENAGLVGGIGLGTLTGGGALMATQKPKHFWE